MCQWYVQTIVAAPCPVNSARIFLHAIVHFKCQTQSVLKLLGRIILPSDIQPDDARNAFSDPLTHFTCVLSALVHDIGHPGVPNSQLVKERSPLAAYYNGQSVAERNSFDVAWELLMKPEYANLRGAIYSDEEEMHRFHYLTLSAIMATDIADDKLKAIRNMQWQRAFVGGAATEESPRAISSRKATIVVQYLMQASDWAHTMQHWHVYRKWNERYFHECVGAYRAGRAMRDPAQEWYQGELSFFNNYVIPLTRKLKDCGVFGVSSEEYLNYAVKNRDQWESQGREIVGEMLAKLSE
jgi:3'5'-cyclic nucleotide phosphodiesterase